jgi:hypothetical protein
MTGIMMTVRKLPLRKPLDAAQGSHFNEQISGTPGTTIEVMGPLPAGLSATSRGSRLTISGTPHRPGNYEVTIIEKRAKKVTIRVGQPRSVFTTPIMDLMTGKRASPPPPPSS